MPEERKTVIAHIVEKRTGIARYNGPLSVLGEQHAAEFGFKYGLVTGLFQGAPSVAAGAATLTGVSTMRKFADTGIPSFAKRNALYVIVAFIVGLAIGSLVGPQLPNIA